MTTKLVLVFLTVALAENTTTAQHLYRTATGKWVRLSRAQDVNGLVALTLSHAELPAGKTVVLVNKPDWLIASDSQPPKIMKVVVDGRSIKPTSVIDLGWLETPPREIVVETADTQNPLDPESVRMCIGASMARPGSAVLTFLHDPKDRRRGRIICHLREVNRSQQSRWQPMTIHSDDFAPDTADCRISFVFTVVQPPQIDFSKPSATTPESVRIFVDSIFPRYENVECLLDGKVHTVGTTTVGATWASAETSNPHWMCFQFPQSRAVSGIEISWARYPDIIWASERYVIMTWDGARWISALHVHKNPKVPTSRHTFKPVMTDRVLIWVPAGGNHPLRPDLTWVSEVKLLP